MQRKKPATLAQKALAEVTALPNPETANYKVAAAATAFLAFDTFVSGLNCGNFSFYLNAAATLLSAGVTANQYFQGAPMNAAKGTYARFFGSAKDTAKVKNDLIENTADEPALDAGSAPALK